jgi:hypothetical protein
MWRLVKADIRYNWHIFIISIALAVVLLIVIGVILGWPNLDQDLPGTRSLLMAIVTFAFFVRILSVMGEKRDRYHVLLPLSGTAIALSRPMSIICLWAGFVLLYWLITSTVRPFQKEIIVFEMVAVSGFVLTANALPYIQRDVSTRLHNNFQRALWMIVGTACVGVGVVLFFTLNVTQSSWQIMRVFLPLKNQISPYLGSFLGAGLFLFVGLVLTWASVHLFKKRKAFVE